MQFNSEKAVLVAAIDERQELVQFLWFYGHEVEAVEHYKELRRLRARLKEVLNANTGLSDPRTDGDTPTE